MFFCFSNFWRENDVTKLAPKLFLSIMEHFMTVSERTCHGDPETGNKYREYVDPIKSYDVLTFAFPPFCYYTIYRALRTLRITDKNVYFQLHATLQFCPATKLALHFFYWADNHWPGHY